MSESQKREMKWYSPQALARKADDGFVFVVQSTGNAICSLPSVALKGITKVGWLLSKTKRKKKKIKQETKSVETTSPKQNASPETAVDARQVFTPSPAENKTLKPAKNSPPPVMKEETGSMELETLLKQYAFEDKVEAMRLHKALEDLLHGTEAARLRALDVLVGMREVAEPFLVASLKTASPEVSEIVLEGLSQIGSQRLIGCISDVFASPGPEKRLAALRAAQRLTDDEAQPFLERGLKDPSAKVKRRSLSYITWRESSWAIAEIRRLCEDSESEVKWAALEALLVMSPSEAYDNLELMMSSLDPVHRRRAETLLKRRKSLSNKDSPT